MTLVEQTNILSSFSDGRREINPTDSRNVPSEGVASRFLTFSSGIPDVSPPQTFPLFFPALVQMTTSTSTSPCFDILRKKLRFISDFWMWQDNSISTNPKESRGKQLWLQFPHSYFPVNRIWSVPTRRSHAAPQAEGPAGENIFFLMNLRDASRSCSRHAGPRPVTMAPIWIIASRNPESQLRRIPCIPTSFRATPRQGVIITRRRKMQLLWARKNTKNAADC